MKKMLHNHLHFKHETDDLLPASFVEMTEDTNGNKPVIVFTLLFLIFFTLSLIRYVFIVFAVWSFTFGIGLGFLLTSNFKEVPNLLSAFLPIYNSKGHGKKLHKYKGCTVCGENDCGRHRPDMALEIVQPWINLYIPERVDKALTEFLEILLRTHVYSWYWEISHDQSFVDEIRKKLRFILATLYQRIEKVDLPEFILTKCLSKFAMHLDCFQKTKERVLHGEDMQTAVLSRLGQHKHFALQSETAEADYLRYVSERLIPILLPANALGCRSQNTLLRELLSNIILMPLVEKFGDPDFVNQMLLVLLDEEPLAEMTGPPSPDVNFLDDFAKERKPKSDSPLQISAYDLIHDQSLLFLFMQFMNRAGALNLLQFCLAVEDFNKRSLAYDLKEDQQEKMFKEAKEILQSYFLEDSVDKINFPKEVVEDFCQALESPEDGMVKLKTAAPLFKAYEHVLNILEDIYVPMFHHSREFYLVLCGDRSPVKQDKVNSRSSKRGFMRLTDFSKIATKIKEKKKAVREDRALAIFLDEIEPETPPEISEEYDEESVDLGSDIIVNDMGEVHDLSYWHISIPRVDSIFERNKKVLVFVVLVDCIGTQGGIRSDERWHVMRKYSEFYVLDSKLRRFHDLLPVADLPPKRTILKKDLDFLNSCKIPFQEYLQCLVRHPVLRGSGLLHSFLSPGAQITGMFEPDSMGKEAGRKIKSISNKFVLERGQNLESFLQSYLASAEPPLKKRIPPRSQPERIARTSKQKVDSKMFLPPPNWAADLSLDTTSGVNASPKGITEYLIFFCRTLLDIPDWCLHVLTCVRFFAGATIDAYVKRYLAYKLRLATTEAQLVTLIRLVRDAIFFDSDPPRTDSEKLARRDETLEGMLKFIPEKVRILIGEDNHDRCIKMILEMLQNPRLNKQLLYQLLDSILLELFPELR